jgi:hypothetical protein
MNESICIDDSVFSHSKTSSWINKSDIFEWDRENFDNYEEIVLTDLKKFHLYPNKKKYGWIIEPPSIDASQYIFAKNNSDKFEKIFTYSRELLEFSKKFEFVPVGMCWVSEDDRKIYEKNKLVCTISSFKKMTLSHNFRHQIIKKIKNIDVYGNGYYPIENKVDVLKDYMFSVVVENQKMDYFFSEKIIDCFVTGTIPIYYGCPSINRFFDIEGILTFDSIPELEEIINNLDENLFRIKKSAIEKNFELAKKYLIADDTIYKKIKNKN